MNPTATGSGTDLLALAGGGFKALAADAGMFAGLMRYYTSDLSTLLPKDIAISANSGSTWFVNLLAYSDSFVNSLNDYERLFKTDINLDEPGVGGDDGFLGVMGECYEQYLYTFLSGNGLASLLQGVNDTSQFVQFLTASPANIARLLIAAALDGSNAVLGILDQRLQGKTGYDTLRGGIEELLTMAGTLDLRPYLGTLAVALFEGVDWNRFMQRVVFAPDQVDQLMQSINFYSGNGRTSVLASQPLIYELAVSADEAALAPLSVRPGDGLVTITATNKEAEYGGLIKSTYNFLPASATSIPGGDKNPAPWLPTIPSGDLSVEYDSPAWFDSQQRTYLDLDFEGLSAFLASSISSAAAAAGPSFGVLKDFSSVLGATTQLLDGAAKLLGLPQPSNVLATYTAGLAPLVQSRRHNDGSWSAGDPPYSSNNYSDPLISIDAANAANSAFLRMADGGYFDNSSVTSGLSYLAANQSSWRSNDGIQDFDISLFVFSSKNEEVSDTLKARGFGQIGNVAERLFTGGKPQEFRVGLVDLADVSHPSPAIFDSTKTSGMSTPVWTYRAPADATGVAAGFGIEAYDLYTTTASNNSMQIPAGYEGQVRLWKIISATEAIPLASGGSWDDYRILYQQIIEALQTKDEQGVYGANLLAHHLGIPGTPTGLGISNALAVMGTPAGTTVGKLTTMDPDTNDHFSYALVTGKGDTDNGFFVIREDELVATKPLDYQNNSNYSVRVRSTDSKGLWIETTVTIEQPAVLAGPVREANVLLDRRLYAHGQLISNCNLMADSGDLETTTNESGEIDFGDQSSISLDGNGDGRVDWRDAMVIAGSVDADGRIHLNDSISGVDLCIPLVGLPGQNATILTTLKYAALLRWQEQFELAGQPLTPELINDHFTKIIRDVPEALQDDSFNPYASLFAADAAQREQALNSLAFAYSNLAIVKTVIEVFQTLGLDYESPQALAMWQYNPDEDGADRPEIIAFSAYGSAISNLFNPNGPLNPADPYKRRAVASQYDYTDATHIRAVLKEILAEYPVTDVLAEAALTPDVLTAYGASRNRQDQLTIDRFLEQKYGLFLDNLSTGLAQIVSAINSRLRESARLDPEFIIPSIAGGKRFVAETLATSLVELAADHSLDSLDGFAQRYRSLFLTPLPVDREDRIVDAQLSLSTENPGRSSDLKLLQAETEDRQEISLVIKIKDLQGNPELTPDSGLSVRFRLGGTAVEGEDYQLGPELADRTFWIPRGQNWARLPITILNPQLSHAGRTLDVQLLSSDSGFGIDAEQSVVHITLPGGNIHAGQRQSGAASSFEPFLVVTDVDQDGLLRAPGREAKNIILEGHDGKADRFLLTLPQPDRGLPHISNFDPEDGDVLVIDRSMFPGASTSDFNTYGGVVFHLPSKTPLALISDQGADGSDRAWCALSPDGGYYSIATLQPILLHADSQGALTSAQDQALLFQLSSTADVAVEYTTGNSSITLAAMPAGAKAWGSEIASQVLSSDLAPESVRAIDGACQGSVVEALLHREESVAVSIASDTASVHDPDLGNDSGFADFVTGDDSVHVTRPVIVASTPEGGSNLEGTVKLRQNGSDSQAIFFYRVDDLTGVINGLSPGDEGYEQEVQSRLYTFADGATSLQGPGHGLYREARLTGVTAGDMLAMGLINQSHDQQFYGFSRANERLGDSPTQHLWSYGNGANIFGFEDTFGGGDRDFNDSVFMLSFQNLAV